MDIKKVIDKFKNDTSKRNFRFNKPASDELIQKVESLFDINLSDDLKYFYRTINGIESDDEFIFRIISLDEVIDNYNRDGFDYYAFAEYLIYCDTWDFEFNDNEIKIAKYINDNNVTYRLIWTDSFVDFLNLYYEKDLDGLLEREKELSLDQSNKKICEAIAKTDLNSEKIDNNSTKTDNVISKISNWILKK